MPDKLDRYVRRGNLHVKGWLEAGAVKSKQGYRDTSPIAIHHRRPAREAARTSDCDRCFGQQESNPEGDLAQFMESLVRYAGPTALIIHEGDCTRIRGHDVINLAGGPFGCSALMEGTQQPSRATTLRLAKRRLLQADWWSLTIASTRNGRMSRRGFIGSFRSPGVSSRLRQELTRWRAGVASWRRARRR
jgi:hypothetical protein